MRKAPFHSSAGYLQVLFEPASSTIVLVNAADDANCSFDVTGPAWAHVPPSGPMGVYLATGVVGLQNLSIDAACPGPYDVSVWANASYLVTDAAAERPHFRTGEEVPIRVRAAVRLHASTQPVPLRRLTVDVVHNASNASVNVSAMEWHAGSQDYRGVVPGVAACGRAWAVVVVSDPAGEWNPRHVPVAWEVRCAASRFHPLRSAALFHPMPPGSPLFSSLEVQVLCVRQVWVWVSVNWFHAPPPPPPPPMEHGTTRSQSVVQRDPASPEPRSPHLQPRPGGLGSSTMGHGAFHGPSHTNGTEKAMTAV